MRKLLVIFILICVLLLIGITIDKFDSGEAQKWFDKPMQQWRIKDLLSVLIIASFFFGGSTCKCKSE